MNPENETLNLRLTSLFGPEAHCESPLSESGAGVRFTGIDLSGALSEKQVGFLLDALSQFRILCIAGQDLSRFSLAHMERFANHWGAPIPHPSNLMRGGKPGLEGGDSDGPIELLPYEKRWAADADTAFPGKLQCLPHESPTVLVVSNFIHTKGEEKVNASGNWHTDIEYEPVPIYLSMFLVHNVPVARNASGGNWLEAPEDSNDMPLNGETAFADTAAAFAALPADEQAELERVQLRRRLNEGDEGWLAPLVRIDPRSGIKSLHSPLWNSRPNSRPDVEVDGMTMEESKSFLGRLEAHVLQPQFRYKHVHRPGDVTIWNNFMTLHCSPAMKMNISSIDDARLLYRLSCKGKPALSLPRLDDPEWLDANIDDGYSTPQEIIDC